ncbi:MAG TPA: hypothetical protein VLC08_01300 [Chitinolyticbacter sp.]|uniref:hypothetical protein n=1 Tax=Chitinolyticbacter albus TaxID=2961951 RepID=UPI0021088F39|nr:hypothetical protein [Chitinolyticbacter albus]HSC78965.1 hypothetical protein [Chitinolyticbacter sp.]
MKKFFALAALALGISAAAQAEVVAIPVSYQSPQPDGPAVCAAKGLQFFGFRQGNASYYYLLCRS